MSINIKSARFSGQTSRRTAPNLPEPQKYSELRVVSLGATSGQPSIKSSEIDEELMDDAP